MIIFAGALIFGGAAVLLRAIVRENTSSTAVLLAFGTVLLGMLSAVASVFAVVPGA